MQKITPFLWFDGRAEEAANFYTAIFENSAIDDASATSVTFRLAGQRFMALNGGPQFTFSPAVSFFVNCESQAEVDDLWERLSAGGEKGRCGWLTDKFGVSWQIIPSLLGELLGDDDAQTSERVLAAMLRMSKIEIGLLRQAADAA